jgi:hypothetical protein
MRNKGKLKRKAMKAAIEAPTSMESGTGTDSSLEINAEA